MDITIMDTSFIDVAVIDQFESLIWTERYQECGDFELYLPADRELFPILSINNYLRIQDSDCVMIIEGLELQTDEENGDHLIVTGRSLESLLTRRIVWPQTVLRGNVQNAIKKLVENNIGRLASADRKIPNLVFVESNDSAVSSLTGLKAQFTGDLLSDAIRSICEVYGLGFKITLSATNQFSFTLYSGLNRTYSQSANDTVVFSPEYDTLLSSNYKYSAESLKTVAIVAGEGEGSERKHQTATLVEATGINRRELYVDARDISSTIDDGTLTDEEYQSLLAQRGLEKLTATIKDVELDAVPVVGYQYELRKDYSIGDIVEIENSYGLGGVCRVMEVIISVNSEGYQIYPSFSKIKIYGDDAI